MRLATFNIEHLGDRKDTAPFEQRAAVLRPQLQRLDADILCLQEIDARKDAGKRTLPALDLLLAGTPYAEFHRAAAGKPDGGLADVHNLVVLSRYPIRSRAALGHHHVPPPRHGYLTAEPGTDPADIDIDVRWDRPALVTTVDLPDGPPLHLFNIHLRSPLASAIPGGKAAPFVWSRAEAWAEGFFLSSVKRNGQALELRIAIDRLFDDHPEALIAVAGDFNAQDHDVAVRIIAAGEDDTGSGALAHRALTPVSRSLARDRRFSTLHHGRPHLPDHILVSRALLGRFRRCEIHNETLDDELVAYGRIDRPPESLHAPMLAVFTGP